MSIRPLILGSTLLLTTITAHAATNCPHQPQTDALSRLAQQEDCLNTRLRNNQQTSQAKMDAQRQKLETLRQKYQNAPADQRAHVQSQIQKQQDKLAAWQTKNSQQIDQLRKQPAQQRQRTNDLINKTHSDINSFLNGH